MRYFILNTRSESGDDYTYFIEHESVPSNYEINLFLIMYGNDTDENVVYEYPERLEEIKDFKKIPK